MFTVHGLLRISVSRAYFRQCRVDIKAAMPDQPRSEDMTGTTAPARAVDNHRCRVAVGISEKGKDLPLKEGVLAKMEVFNRTVEHVRMAKRGSILTEEVDAIVREL